MTSPFTLPIMGGSLLAAVAFGIHLGSSAVGEIDPAYFQGPALHPRDRGVAIDERPAGLHRTRTAYSDLYGWEQGEAMRAAECGDCKVMRASEAYAYSAVVPYFGPGRSRTSKSDFGVAPATDVVDLPTEEGQGGPLESAVDARPDVSRYANYPLTYEEAAFAAETGQAEAAAVPLPH
ncbi:MAG: hypothetical protein ACXWUP_01480 [Allosphingosinicella sp.]